MAEDTLLAGFLTSANVLSKTGDTPEQNSAVRFPKVAPEGGE
jgi:hypothetical protein